MRGSWLIIVAATVLICSLILFLIFDDRLGGGSSQSSPTTSEPIPVDPDGGIEDDAAPPGDPRGSGRPEAGG